MISDDVLEMVATVMESYPENQWIEEVKRIAPDLEESEIVEMVMILNVPDRIETE